MTRRRTLSLAFAAALLLSGSFSASAFAKAPNEAERVRLAVEKKSGTDLPKPIRATRSAVPGIWEIQLADGNIVYTNSKATHLFVGALIDLESKQNLTQERIRQLSSISWGELPFEHAIVRRQGNGSRKVALFSDPNCNYCKKQEEILSKLENVTIYTFLIPLLGPSSQRAAEGIWCSTDPEKTLNHWWTQGLPSETPKCDAPIAANMALASRLAISSTPTFVFPSMKKSEGYLDLQALQRLLSANQESKKPASK